MPTLPKWREAEQLARLVQFVVIPRPGETPATLPAPFRMQILTGWPLKLSSSQVRARRARRSRRGSSAARGVGEVIREAAFTAPDSRPNCVSSRRLREARSLISLATANA